MPFFGSVGGNFEAKGIGGYHSGVTPIENDGVTTSIGSAFAIPQNGLQLYISSSAGSGLITPSNFHWQTIRLTSLVLVLQPHSQSLR
jgi:hypothetical protein